MKRLLLFLLWLIITVVIMGQTRQDIEKMPNVTRTQIVAGVTAYLIPSQNDDLLCTVVVFNGNQLVGTGFISKNSPAKVISIIENSALYIKNLGENGLYLDLKTHQPLLVSPYYDEGGLHFIIIQFKEDIWK